MSQKPYYFVDYKQPMSAAANDRRTAYDFGHQNRFVSDIYLIPIEGNLRTLRSAKSTYNTENDDQFRYKTSTNYTNNYDLAAPHEKLQFAKTMFESIQKYPLKEIKICTNYQNEYEAKKLALNERKGLVHSCREHEKLERHINPNDSCFHKLLDIYASTNVLDYPVYSGTQLNSVSKMDNITVWDWLNVPKARGFRLNGIDRDPYLQRSDKPKISGIACSNIDENRVTLNSMKFVPNRGLLSEHQEQFQAHIKSDPFTTIGRSIKPKEVFISSPSFLAASEYSMYGSGQPISAVIQQE